MTNKEEHGRIKESKGDTGNSIDIDNSESLDLDTKDKLDFDPKAPRPNYERLPQPEIDRRVLNCINLRYKADKPILQREWVELCKEQYGDKSVPQYINYWMKAKEEWEEGWRGELENLLEPAIETLREGLSSDNHYVRSKTIDQIWKMSGNDIQKHHVLTQQIQVGFTPTEED